MPSISGMILYLVIPRAYANMNPLMSSTQRRSDSSSGNMRKMRSTRNYNTRHSTPTWLPSNRLGKRMLSSGLDPTSLSSVPRHLWLQARATTAESPEVNQGVKTETHIAETLVGVTTRTVEVVKVEAIVGGHTRHTGVGPHTVQVGCLV